MMVKLVWYIGPVINSRYSVTTLVFNMYVE